MVKHNTDRDREEFETDADHTQLDASLSINKYIEEKYNDSFSKPGNDIMDYIGTFLTRKESIVLGHSNKQLFIETQKDSYVLKRCKNDDQLQLNDTKIEAHIE